MGRLALHCHPHILHEPAKLETTRTAAILHDLLYFSFYYPFKKLLKYYDTPANAAAVCFYYQANRFEKISYGMEAMVFLRNAHLRLVKMP